MGDNTFIHPVTRRLAFAASIWAAAWPVAACGAESVPESGEQEPEGDQYELPDQRTRMTLQELPPMPGFPAPALGRLVATSDGDFPIHGSWVASAGMCSGVGTIELYTEDPTYGTAIAVHFPDSQPVGVYPVLPPDSVSDSERVAHIGVQIFRDQDAFGLRAINGTLNVSAADGYMSGRFQSTLREKLTKVLTRYVGAFERVPLEALSPDYCAMLRDSLQAYYSAPDSGDANPTREESG